MHVYVYKEKDACCRLVGRLEPSKRVYSIFHSRWKMSWWSLFVSFFPTPWSTSSPNRKCWRAASFPLKLTCFWLPVFPFCSSRLIFSPPIFSLSPFPLSSLCDLNFLSNLPRYSIIANSGRIRFKAASTKSKSIYRDSLVLFFFFVYSISVINFKKSC